MLTVREMLIRAMPENASEQEVERFYMQCVNFFNEAERKLEAIRDCCVQVVNKIENDNKRASLLRVYRKRHSWKKADLPRLRTYSLNRAARNRVAKLIKSKQRGRGVTCAYCPIVEGFTRVIQHFSEMYDPATPPHRRLALLRKTAWFPEFVAATYRGEYQRLKKLGGRAVSEHAAQAVAEAFCISVPTLRQLCKTTNKGHAVGVALSDAIEIADFDVWKTSGHTMSSL